MIIHHRMEGRYIRLPETGIALKPGTFIAFTADCQEIIDGPCLKLCLTFGLSLFTTSGSVLELPFHHGIPWHDLPDVRSDRTLWRELCVLTDDSEGHDAMTLNRAYFRISVTKWLEGKLLCIEAHEEGLVLSIDTLSTSTTLDRLETYFDLVPLDRSRTAA
jgi:hypothetical protein